VTQGLLNIMLSTNMGSRDLLIAHLFYY